MKLVVGLQSGWPGCSVSFGFTKDAEKVRNSVKLTRGGKKTIGNLFEIRNMDAAKAIIERGGTNSNVRKALGKSLQGKTVGDIANLAAKGDDAALTALKIIKQAAKKGQR